MPLLQLSTISLDLDRIHLSYQKEALNMKVCVQTGPLKNTYNISVAIVCLSALHLFSLYFHPLNILRILMSLKASCKCNILLFGQMPWK